jgi:tRNA-2-methylthio-N6-dimethylallyladenosine synthase
MKKFHIRTYGCQMNERDSEALACLLEDHGYSQADSESDADIILINTCSVREMAETKALGKAGILVRRKRQNPNLILGIVGCMAQNYGSDILEKVPHVDLVIGTDRLHLLPEILADVESGRRGQVHVEAGTEILGALQGHRQSATSAFVSVMRGCNQFCTYCIVPYVRGREKSREIVDICDEVKKLVDQGTKEIFLLGQNITAYGVAEARKAGGFDLETDSPFAELLYAVCTIPGVERIRFTSPHPRFMNDTFIDAVAEIPQVCEAFHVPLQSGSDRILKAMHRGYDSERYLGIVDKLKSRVPGCSLSTDVIVGFPGETERDFNATRQIMNDVGFDMAYIFKYSPRSGTKAAGLADDIPTLVKEERNQILLADLEDRALALNQRFVGSTVELMVEGPSRRNANRWSGRSRENKMCLFTPVESINAGDIVTLRVERATASSLMCGVACAKEAYGPA